MSEYVWKHEVHGEAERLRLMSELLDPSSRYHLRQLPLPDNASCLEIGAGNGSLSQWVAREYRPDGTVVATDVAPELMRGIEADNLKIQHLDIVHDELPANRYDLVMVRALLHHLPTRVQILERMARALKPGGWLLVHEPDFYPTLVAEDPCEARFWIDFLEWAARREIDYYLGRKIAPRMQRLGLRNIRAEGHSLLYNGGSPFSRWWQLSLQVAAETMIAENGITKEQLDHFLALYDDPDYWTMTIAFTATSGQRPQ